jgi:cytochrome c biogenesis factor
MYAPVSRESALVLNNIFLCSIAAVVFTGTLYPPFANLLFGIQLSVGAPFFNQTVLPLTAPLVVAMAIGPLLPWKRAVWRPALPSGCGCSGCRFATRLPGSLFCQGRRLGRRSGISALA